MNKRLGTIYFPYTSPIDSLDLALTVGHYKRMQVNRQVQIAGFQAVYYV